MARSAQEMQAELESLQDSAGSADEIVRGLRLPASTRPTAGGVFQRQAGNVLGGIGAAALLGPVGVIPAIASMIMTRRENRFAREAIADDANLAVSTADRSRGAVSAMRDQLLAEHGLGADADIEAVRAADPTGVLARELVQLDQLENEVAEGLEGARSLNPQRREQSIQALLALDGQIGQFLDQSTARADQLRRDEFQIARQEVGLLIRRGEEFLESQRRGRTAYEKAMEQWNIEGMSTEQRRAVFNNWMGKQMSISSGEAAMAEAAGGAGGRVGRAAGGLTGAVMRFIERLDEDQMIQFMTRTHTIQERTLSEAIEGVRTQVTEREARLNELNRTHREQSSLLEEYSKAPSGSFRQREPGGARSERGQSDTPRSPIGEGGVLRDLPGALDQMVRTTRERMRPTEETP